MLKGIYWVQCMGMCFLGYVRGRVSKKRNKKVHFSVGLETPKITTYLVASGSNYLFDDHTNPLINKDFRGTEKK